MEIATFRSDIGYSDGRHPDEVRFSRDPREDVARRDFTINGMLLDPLGAQTPGEVLDFVGGRKDLEAGIIRTIGDPEQRFGEDKLRMLRAVRFAARFEYTIEPATFAAMQKLAGQIAVVSRERVRDELTRMLTEGRARRAFLLLDESGLLKQVLPEISAMNGVEQPAEFHPEGDVFVHTLLLLDHLPTPCPLTLAWGALLHDVGQAADIPSCAGSHPVRRARRGGRQDGGRNLPAFAFFERRHGADSGAGGQPHAVRACYPYEGIDAEEVSSNACSSMSIWPCTGRTAWPAIAIWVRMNSSGRSGRRFLRRRCVLRHWSRAMI